MKSIEYNFFSDYESLKCNNQEFEILKGYIHQDGWGWFERDFGREISKTSLLEYTPKDLAIITIKYKDNKTLFWLSSEINDELKYLDWDKEAKDLIRDIRNMKLNKLGI